MIRQSTIDKLHDLRLSAMSDAFECQCRDPETYQGLSFEDRFGMLVDKEWDKRKSTKLQKLIRSAEFRYPNACMEDIEYHPDRNLDKGQNLFQNPFYDLPTFYKYLYSYRYKISQYTHLLFYKVL